MLIALLHLEWRAAKEEHRLSSSLGRFAMSSVLCFFSPQTQHTSFTPDEVVRSDQLPIGMKEDELQIESMRAILQAMRRGSGSARELFPRLLQFLKSATAGKIFEVL